MPAAEYPLAPINLALTPEQKVELLRLMVRIRRFEDAATYFYQGGRMAGFLSLQIGQENIPVAVRSLLGPDDHVISQMRCFGHAIAAGMTMSECMAELYGKATGCSKGKAGAMLIQNPSRHFWGGHAFAGSQMPLACGLAFGLKHRETPGVVVCSLGDGAMNTGAAHEAFNLAALFRLPVVFVIENNGFAIGTSVQRSSAMKDSLAQRVEGYGMAWDVSDGDSLYELRAKLHPMLERARLEHRPSLIGVYTYRFTGASIADAMNFLYRPKAEVDDRIANHDPLKLWEGQLLTEGVIGNGTLAMLRRAAWDEAGAACDFAEQSPFPTPEAIFEDIFWETDHHTAAGSTGRHFFES